MKFIKLTSYNNLPVVFQVDEIVSIFTVLDGSYTWSTVCLKSEKNYQLKESVEQIFEMIK